MAIRAVVFDIGGVLEFTPNLGVAAKWEDILRLEAGTLSERLRNVWQAGSIGTMSEAEVRQAVGRILNITVAETDAFMADIWKQYLGELNVIPQSHSSAILVVQEGML